MKIPLIHYLLKFLTLTVNDNDIASVSEPEPYGAKVVFEDNSPLQFADFKLTFLGGHLVAPPQYPRGWVVYEFRIVRGTESIIVSWTAGLGDISPSFFTISGICFSLELGLSNTLGQLQGNELVITKHQA